MIESCNATLDVEKDNIEFLLNDIQQICEEWDMILNKTKLAENTGISREIPANCNFRTEPDGEQHYKANVFLVITDSCHIRSYTSI
jgi:hypothetical protein